MGKIKKTFRGMSSESSDEESYVLDEPNVCEDPQIEGRWGNLSSILSRSSPMASEGFEPDLAATMKFLRKDSRVLCIGAGGLGCDLLKCLALSGFRSIHVVDMDTIDATNLNRQFLFRASDVGKSKAEAAAAFVNNRVAGVQVHPFMGKMQEKPEEYYQKFHVVICGLDSVPARRWINSTLVNLLAEDDDGNVDLDTVVPMIDAGTEGFKGHTRVIFPGVTSCLECTIELFPPTEKVPLCTVAATPRNAAHCIQYAGLIAWEKEAPFKDDKGGVPKYDTDNPDHMNWLYERALARAKEFNIEGVTLKKTQGVIKNIIPAIASTNALAAAAAVNEALKLATDSAPYLKNCMMYNGEEGSFVSTQQYFQNPNCTVCGNPNVNMTVPGNMTLQGIFDMLADNVNYQLVAPGASSNDGPLYVRSPKMLETALRKNLDAALSDLIQSGETIEFTDPTLNGVSLPITFTFEAAEE